MMLTNSVCKERILSEEYRDFIIGNKIPPSIAKVDPSQLCAQKLPYDYQCVYVENAIGDALNLDVYYYNSIPKCYGLLDVQAMSEVGISQIQNYPTLQLKGNNVMIGFLDTGIDYQHEAFRDIGGQTRIEAIWDQTIQSGTPPEGFIYGSEYTKAMINEALKMEQPLEMVPSVDENSHGTFVASVAAGSINIEEGFIGGAPEATIAMVKLKESKQYLKEFYQIKSDAICFQENDIMMGIQYLKKLADSKNMPLVLCIALGTNLGSHTGISPLANILNRYADVGSMGIVTGVGNEANERQHFRGDATEEIEIRVEQGTEGFVVELWTEIPNLVNVSVVSPSGEILPPSPLRKGDNGEYVFTFEKTRVYMDYRLLMERSNSELVYLRFEKPVEGIWKLLVELIQFTEGDYHLWITDRRFLTSQVYFLESSPDTTICEPANAFFPMTVGYYDGRQDSVDIQSGRGYTRTGRIKPDFVAPGVNVKGAIPRNQYTKRTGSSIATAVTAGAVALLLEWNVYYFGERNVSSIQLKNLLILGAERDAEVVYPNTLWGACVILVLG